MFGFHQVSTHDFYTFHPSSLFPSNDPHRYARYAAVAANDLLLLSQTTAIMTSQAGNNTVIPTYQDPTKISFGSESEKYCITCGKFGNVNRCARCKGAWYCDRNCQQADWPCHKILCAKYAKLNESEPIKNGYRAFLFRAGSLEPELLVLPVTSRGQRDSQPITSLLHHEESKFGQYLEYPGFRFNARLEMPYIYPGEIFLGMQVVCRETFSCDGSPPNKSIFASVKAIGKKPPQLWAGNIIVQRQQNDSRSGLRAGSVTMADFRHTIDWFAFYPQIAAERRDPGPYNRIFLGPLPWPAFASIQGIQINNDEQHINDDSERYKTVSVPASHPVRGLEAELQGDISPISKRVGLPLRVTMRPTQLRDPDADGRMWTCVPAAALMRSLDKDTDAAQPQIAFCLPRGGLPFIEGAALVVRVDDKDLSLDDVKAMVFFSKSTCCDVFQGVAQTSKDDKPDLEAAMQRALDFMTWDNYLLAFDELGMPRPQRPAEEAFVDMRGSGTPDDAMDES